MDRIWPMNPWSDRIFDPIQMVPNHLPIRLNGPESGRTELVWPPLDWTEPKPITWMGWRLWNQFRGMGMGFLDHQSMGTGPLSVWRCDWMWLFVVDVRLDVVFAHGLSLGSLYICDWQIDQSFWGTDGGLFMHQSWDTNVILATWVDVTSGEVW